MDADTKFDDDDLVICLPNQICGEVGEPLQEEVVGIVRAMADAGYWPVDFGENTGTYTELWFSNSTSDELKVKDQAEWFIKNNGDV